MKDLELIHSPATGSRSGLPPVLFIHGAFFDAWCWQQYFMPYLAKQGVESWALSLRGHGNSPGREDLDRLSVDDYLHDIESTLARLPVPPVLVGHSMGGFLVQQLINTHSELPGVALLAPLAPCGILHSSLNLLGVTPVLFARLNWHQQGWQPLQKKDICQLLFAAEPDETLMQAVRAHGQTESSRAVADLTLACMLPQKKINQIPALVVGAEQDRLIPRQDIVGCAAQLHVEPLMIPDCGHMMMLDEQWQQPAQALLEWVRTLRKKPQSRPAVQKRGQGNRRLAA